MLYLMFPEELIESIQKKTLNKLIENIISEFEDITLTLLIFGFKQYSKTNKVIKINRYEMEESLTEIQLTYNCCHRLQETPDDIAQTVGQFSKAIAEIPFKYVCKMNLVYVCIYIIIQNNNILVKVHKIYLFLIQ